MSDKLHELWRRGIAEVFGAGRFCEDGTFVIRSDKVSEIVVRASKRFKHLDKQQQKWYSDFLKGYMNESAGDGE